MSADNGIYILKTPVPPIKEDNSYFNQHEQFEYRVAACSAIDNIDYSELYLPLYFACSPVFSTQNAAMTHALALQKEIEDKGWFTEYGICNIESFHYFPNMTAKAAAKALDCYVGAEPLDFQE